MRASPGHVSRLEDTQSAFRRLIAEHEGQIRAWLPAVLVAYFVLLGGTEAGVTGTLVRAVNLVIAGALTLAWIRRLPRDNDHLDRAVLVAVLAFLFACLLSRFPRQSFDAALNALGYAAAFYLARRELAGEPARTRLVLTLAGLAGLFTVAAAVTWGRTWLEWGLLSGFRAWPPVDLPLPVLIYRHPHVVGMLVVLLAPALVMTLGRWRHRLALPILSVALVLVALVAFMSGSRTTWAAAVLASLVLAVGLAVTVGGASGVGRLLRTSPRLTGGVVVAAAALVVIAWLAAPDELVGRLTNLGTLGERGRIWGAALDVWRASPFAGAGPGSFPLALGPTGLFDLMPFMPRHADNAGVQLLAEAGLLGVVVAGVLALTAIAVVRGAGARAALPAVWGAAFFAFASVTDNPSDTANLVGLLVVWGALATSAAPAADRAPLAQAARPTWPLLRVATTVATAVVGIAVLAVTLGSVAFDAARASLRSGQDADAHAALSVAAALDPAMALYHRERGALSLALGDRGSARMDLERAARRNPSDDAALRGLAVIASLEARHADALAAARAAADLQHSDAANILVVAWVATRAGEPDLADAALVEAILQAPWVAGSEHWGSHFPTGDHLAGLLARAADEWASGAGTSVIGDIEPTWLAALSGRQELAEPAAAGTSVSRTSRLLTAALACSPGELDGAIADAMAADGHRSAYWEARIIAQRLTGSGDAVTTLRLTQLRASYIAYLAVYPPEPLHPFAETSGQDARFYRREALPPVDVGLRLPSPDGGMAAWLQDPRGAAARGAPGTAINECP